MTPKQAELDVFIRGAAHSVDAELDRLIPSGDAEPTSLHQAIRHSVFAGGKRFRPALVFAVGESLGAAREELLATAAAIEMIHTYSLIHDDLPAMDDDDLRRGRSTCHVKFGEATAILAGDVLQALAFRAVAGDELLSSETRVRLVHVLADSAGTPDGMAAGQQMDLQSEGKEIAALELEEIHRKKTGAMIVASARAGSLIAGANEESLESVSRFASLLGLLFQITDDLLDVTQPTEVLGKTAGKDVSVKKATYPAIYGIEETRNLAANVHQKACAEIAALDESGLLREIAGFVLTRNT